MYFLSIVLLMVVLPVASVLIEWAAAPEANLLGLIGNWFVFWGVGWRLLTAGLKQMINPAFTAGILGIKEKAAHRIVAEHGMSNAAIGAVGVLTFFNPAWIGAAAVAGLIMFGLAGIQHLRNPDRTGTAKLAMWSDLWIALVLAIYLAFAWAT